MLLSKENSGLMVIDVQSALTPLVLNVDHMIDRCHWTMRLAEVLNVPTLVTEQYPKGLGWTVAPLNGIKCPSKPMEKVHFSCAQDAAILKHIQSMHVTQWVLVGIETHVCVLQTAIDLIAAGYAVYVVVDAVSARTEMDHKYGLKRMKQHGAELVTSEMVFFEWEKQAGTPLFKSLSQTFLRSNAWK
jgi:nicotinamidase-related amidase